MARDGPGAAGPQVPRVLGVGSLPCTVLHALCCGAHVLGGSGRGVWLNILRRPVARSAVPMEIGDRAFFDTSLQGTLVMPLRVTTIGSEAFWNTELTGLDLSKATHLSKATSLVEIGGRAFADASVEGTLV